MKKYAKYTINIHKRYTTGTPIVPKMCANDTERVPKMYTNHTQKRPNMNPKWYPSGSQNMHKRYPKDTQKEPKRCPTDIFKTHKKPKDNASAWCTILKFFLPWLPRLFEELHDFFHDSHIFCHGPLILHHDFQDFLINFTICFFGPHIFCHDSPISYDDAQDFSMTPKTSFVMILRLCSVILKACAHDSQSHSRTFGHDSPVLTVTRKVSSMTLKILTARQICGHDFLQSLP